MKIRVTYQTKFKDMAICIVIAAVVTFSFGVKSENVSYNANTDYSNITHGNCTVLEFWITDYKEVVNVMSRFHTSEHVKNTWVFGLNNLRGRRYLIGESLLGNISAITYDQEVVESLAISMEFTAGALTMAVKDFCRQRESKNMTFM